MLKANVGTNQAPEVNLFGDQTNGTYGSQTPGAVANQNQQKPASNDTYDSFLAAAKTWGNPVSEPMTTNKPFGVTGPNANPNPSFTPPTNPGPLPPGKPDANTPPFTLPTNHGPLPPGKVPPHPAVIAHAKTKFAHIAVSDQGHTIGSNDGNTWFDAVTNQLVR